LTLPPSFQVLFISGQDGGTRRYRCYHHQEQLEQQGIATDFREATDFHLLADALNYDVFILHRVPYSDLIGRFLELVHQRGKIAIFETDDLVFEPDMVQYDGIYRTLPPVEERQYLRKIRGCLKTLQKCDYALTTTEYLADRLRRRGKQTFINRNAVSAEFVRLAREAERNRIEETNERVLIGYISGSSSHDQDFETISDVLARVMERHPHVELRIIGPLNLSERLNRFHERIHSLPFIRWQDIPRENQAIDINLAPLEQDNPFCQCKSELKYFEAGILGIPVVASRTEAFEFAVRHGETGLLAGDSDEWFEYLDLLITDPDRRRAIGEAARRDVLQNYTSQARSLSFSRLLRDLVVQHQPDTDVLLEPGQVERQVIAHLADILEELTAPPDLSHPARLEDDIRWRRHYLLQQLGEALVIVRRERRRPLARIKAWVKHLAKRMTRQVYRLEREKQVYQLIGELTGGQVYSQTFQASAPNLCRVDVLFATFGRINTPDLIFRLKESPTAKLDLVTHTVSASLFRDNCFYPFTFAPLPNSAGKHYSFSIESPDAVRGDALGVWTQPGVTEAAGTMYKNDRPVVRQLAYTVQYKDQDAR